ncbi:MAG: DUF371 domain-containing protein [Nanoarchaeota archaeon]
MGDIFKFKARGHANIVADHPTTLEITKDSHLSPRGDCIVGVSADFDTKALQEFLSGAKSLCFTLRCQGFKECIRATSNQAFKADKEIVIRRGPFISDRTIATGADRACFDLSREFVEIIKNPDAVIEVIIEKDVR